MTQTFECKLKGRLGVGYYVDKPASEAADGTKKKKSVYFGCEATGDDERDEPKRRGDADTSGAGPVDQASAAIKSAADALFAQGDASGAVEKYTTLLATMPPSTKLGHAALSNRSACYLAQQQWAECAADCD